MSQIVFRANLAATGFPLTVDLAGRTVVVKQADQTHVPTIQSSKDMDKDTGIPQLMYCHNVMPTGDGYISVDYNQEASAVLTSVEFFSQIVSLREIAEGTLGGSYNRIAYLGITLTGHLYYHMAPMTSWTRLPDIAEVTSAAYLTVAHVGGVSYLYIDGVGCYQFNFSTKNLETVTLNGLDVEDILGIFASQGYLCAYTADAIAWSSTIDVTDFEPSLSTGAGGGKVEQARGKIIAVESNITGFIVYTVANAVVAVYSGNDRYPFNFREISNSGGIAHPFLVSRGANSGVHFAYTTGGLQQVSPVEAKAIFPEVTDFLSSKFMDDFDPTTNTLNRTTLTSTAILKQVNLIADRYVVISYGAASFTHALVYDMALERFGKLKISHMQAFEWFHNKTADFDLAKTSLGFLTLGGAIVTVNFSHTVGSYVSQTDNQATAILGKYQLVRSRLATLHAVEVESVRDGDSFSCSILPTLDGKTFLAPIVGTLNNMTSLVKKYWFRYTGVNHSILLKGRFTLSSLILHMSIHGRR